MAAARRSLASRRRASRPSEITTWIRSHRTALCAILYCVTVALVVAITAHLASRGPPPAAVPVCDSKKASSALAEAVSRVLLAQWTDGDEQTRQLVRDIAVAMPAGVRKPFELATASPGSQDTVSSGDGPESVADKDAQPSTAPPARLPGETDVWNDAPPTKPQSTDRQEDSRRRLEPPEQQDNWDQGEDSQNEQAPTEEPPQGSGVEPAPRSTKAARALLVICYNRPTYLRRTLDAVLQRLPSYDRPHVIISQDGNLPQVAAVVDEAKKRFAADAPDVPFSHIHHPQQQRGGDDGNGYMRLARHFGWALQHVFSRGHERVIVLEDDLEVAPDFFQYMTAAARLLDEDETLLAASAYNDIGQPGFVSDPARVYRSDFFPGLGWLLTARVWAELSPKWPSGYWDDWLREPAQRKGRAFLRPEVSRTRTFGRDGVSHAQFFDQYLGNIKLNDELVEWRSLDLGYLRKGAYDAGLTAAVGAAQKVHIGQLSSKHCEGAAGGGGSSLRGGQHNDGSPLLAARHAGHAGQAFRASYGGVQRYEQAARALGFIADVKAGVPRTAYQGVVAFRMNGCFVYLEP